VDDVDPKALGYADDVRFSYNGGDTSQQPYDSHDTTTDLRTEARRLRDLLEQVHRDHPGMPVDLIAHSQGGLIARAALAYEYARDDTRLPRVANLVTLGTPHQGADLATILTNVSHTASGSATAWALDEAGVTWVDLRGPSVRQLSENSTFLADLNRRELPEGVRFTSIGSRGDVVVPGTHTEAPGARNVLVNVAGWTTDHSKLPGSSQGRREVSLAVAGMPPTCQTLTDMLADTVVSDAIATSEDAAGLGLYAASQWADGLVP
jgi:triacylglycerol esterase/lipase EstA (alpha/beta hydrolase family)